MRCDNGSYSCYVIDNNGYILLSNDCDDTGRFFGEVQGNAMRSLVEMQYFKAITVYDFQAVCKVQQYDDNVTSFATILITVRKHSIFYICNKLDRFNCLCVCVQSLSKC